MNMANEKPLVSVVMNCYNGEEYLQRALDSICAQTYKNLEIIFWDNASTDKSADIYRKISDKDPRFKYFKSEKNLTLGEARAFAVNKCTGDYITFLDTDDEWIPEKTEIQIKAMLEDDYVLGYSSVYEVYNNKSKIYDIRWESGEIFPNLLTQFEIQLPTAIIKRDKLVEKGLNFDPFIQASEEYCLFMQLIYDEKVCVVKQPLAKYYIRKDSLTVKSIDRWAIERRYTLDKIRENHPNYIKYSKEFNEAYARGDYYEARYLVSVGNVKGARTVLAKNISVSYKYLVLYCLLYFPVDLWNKIHLLKNKR